LVAHLFRRLVRTPLWHKENPDKTAALPDDVLWIEPVEIAEVLYEVCTSQSHKGGTIVEAMGQGRRRVVELLNDAGPPEYGLDNPAPIPEEVSAILNKEKSQT